MLLILPLLFQLVTAQPTPMPKKPVAIHTMPPVHHTPRKALGTPKSVVTPFPQFPKNGPTPAATKMP